MGRARLAGAATVAQPALAAYEWRGLGQLTRPRQRLRFLHGQGFTTVYVDLGEYLDAADQPKTPARQALLRRLGGNLGYFVAEASRLGLTVHAVGAGPTGTEPELRYLGPKLVQLVGQYNATAPAAQRLKGVQLDIEPYVHRDMLFNPRYGRLGMVAVPYFWFFEALSPLVEVSGYLIVGVGAFTGFVSPRFAILFVLLAAAFIEFVGYRQFLVLERTLATVQVPFKRGQWGKMRRWGAAAVAAPDPAVTAPPS